MEPPCATNGPASAHGFAGPVVLAPVVVPPDVAPPVEEPPVVDPPVATAPLVELAVVVPATAVAPVLVPPVEPPLPFEVPLPVVAALDTELPADVVPGPEPEAAAGTQMASTHCCPAGQAPSGQGSPTGALGTERQPARAGPSTASSHPRVTT